MFKIDKENENIKKRKGTQQRRNKHINKKRHQSKVDI